MGEKPLTTEELRQMAGQPVWCPDEEAYGIVMCDKIGQWAGIPFLHGVWYSSDDGVGVEFSHNIIGRKLKCYRVISEKDVPKLLKQKSGYIRRHHDGLPELRKRSRYQSMQKRQGIISVLSMVWAKIKGGIRSMIDAKDVENLTKAYLHSFNTALSETRNPSLAGQAAATVLMSICSVILPREQQTASPLEALMAAVMHNAMEAKKGAEGDDPEKKDEKADEDIQKGD